MCVLSLFQTYVNIGSSFLLCGGQTRKKKSLSFPTIRAEGPRRELPQLVPHLVLGQVGQGGVHHSHVSSTLEIIVIWASALHAGIHRDVHDFDLKLTST